MNKRIFYVITTIEGEETLYFSSQNDVPEWVINKKDADIFSDDEDAYSFAYRFLETEYWKVEQIEL